MQVTEAADGAKLENGVVYVARPDHHLTIQKNRTIRLTRGPRENRHRPAVDPLFRSAAVSYGARAIGVILSGSMDDGTAGVLAIKRAGGMAVVLEPSDALYPGMPQSVLENVEAIDFVVPLADVPAAIEECLRRTPHAAAGAAASELMEMEKKISEMDEAAMITEDRPGNPSPFSCPDCGGVLWEIGDGEYARFRCRVGHALSPDTMLGAQGERLEEALWTALKTLEETATLSRRLASRERDSGHLWMMKRFEDRANDAMERAEVIRGVLSGVSDTVPVETQAQPENEATS